MKVRYGWWAVLTSNIGQKLLMSLAAWLWLVFVVVHMAGNLLIFGGEKVYNWYSYQLTSSPVVEFLELILFATLLVHVALGIFLTLKAQGSRPLRYEENPLVTKRGTLPSRFLAIQGLAILAFLGIHLSMFKFGPYLETRINDVAVRDLYTVVAQKMSHPGWYFLYLISLVFLAFHLKHAVKAVAQTWGILNLRNQVFFEKLSWLFALVVFLGYLAPITYLLLSAS